MIHNQARVDNLRKMVADYRAKISDYERRIKDPGMQTSIRFAKNSVEDVENFFLASLECETRTAEQESRWISYAVMALTLAEFKINEIDASVAKYGDNIQALG